MTNRSASVAVIGGGAIGASVLFHLVKQHGITNVVLLEKNQLGSGSTSKAAGGVRNFFTTRANIDIGNWSIDYFKNFEEKVGSNLEFRQTGYVWLYHSAEAERKWRKRVDFCHNHGVAAEILSPSEVVELFPLIDQSSVHGAVLAPDCGHVDPAKVVQGFAKRASEEGIVETGTSVIDVTVKDGEVATVETRDATWDVDVVVNAAGPWAGRVGKMVGVDLPLSLLVRRIMVTSSVEKGNSPLFLDHERQCYFKTDPNGSLLVCDMEQDRYNIENPDTVKRNDISYDYYYGAFEKISPIVPSSSGLDVINGWAGLQTHTPDGKAIISPSEIDGFYVACGFSGHGVQQAPLVGTAMAELIVKGQTNVINLDRFTLDGFESGERGDPESMA